MKTLRIECSDRRFGAAFEQAMEDRFGHAYTIKVPGPDAGVHGNDEHLAALMFFVNYFCGLIEFDRIIIMVHEDCAGCKCAISEHEAHLAEMKKVVLGADSFSGAVETYIARQPQDDDFALWTIDEIDTAQEAVE